MNPERLIPFNRPHMVGKELWYIAQAHQAGQLAGDGPFTKKCHLWLEQRTSARKALLTHSCTAALDMSAMLAGVGPGDEVIMPSFTFVSTANAFVLRGATPVFVDIRPDTLNLDESRIEAAITPRTRAIVPVHYAGIGCEMDVILSIAREHRLLVIEDAAQGLMARYKGRALGSFGQLATLSFHETKNIVSGEGGALLVNDLDFVERAEIIREKGTNRSQFFRGAVDKYTWVDIGSSYLPGELIAAFLWAQLEEATPITTQRIMLWERYHEAFAELEAQDRVRRPVVPHDCENNGHMYYLLLPDLASRTRFIAAMRERGVHTVFHYVPLHSSPAGRKYGRTVGTMHNTDSISERLVRLPLWCDLGKDQQRVIDAVFAVANEIMPVRSVAA
ncbi:MAG TPA: dTDP-4-amino-4,6-dideoxygalactose transaminase [Burkholderiales bacterium]|nr:dTDP-4-amino-4,6-dideoxygalactose transaminase [Burkholderiales bacterium]